jgi:hypothetical protein
VIDQRLRVALSARVSTRDKSQDPELQLVLMREYAARLGWAVVAAYVDYARDVTTILVVECLVKCTLRGRV